MHLLGAAAGPLGGDVLTTRIRVEAGAALRLRSVAATLVQPSPCPAPSSSTVTVDVEDGGTLDAWPEPLLSIAGSDHTVRNVVRIAAGAEVRWVDEVVLGRHDEPGGTIVLRQRIELADRPLLIHTVRPTTRVTVSAMHVGPPTGPSEVVLNDAVRAGRYALGPTATAWVGLGDDLDAVRAVLAALGLRGS